VYQTRSSSFPTSGKEIGSVPFSVKGTGDGLPRQSQRYNVRTCLFPSSMDCWHSHSHRCLPAGNSTPMMPPPTFIENGTDPQNYDAVWTCSRPKRSVPGSRTPKPDRRRVRTAAGAHLHAQEDPLDKWGRGGTILQFVGARRCEDPRCRAGIFMEQQPLQEELCNGYAASLVSAPC
jgi:hypothetical protein